METTSFVQLGFVSSRVFNYPTKYYESTIGGLPNFYLSTDEEKLDLSCPKCKSKLFLVLQLYAPLEQISFRLLYLFACVKRACGFWKVLRNQQKANKFEEEEQLEEQETKENLRQDGTSEKSLFFVGDFDLDSNRLEPQETDLRAMLDLRDLSLKEEVRVKTTSKPKKLNETKKSHFYPKGSFFSPFYVEFDNEPINQLRLSKNEKKYLSQYEMEKNSDNRVDEWVGEKYESNIPDKILWKFQKRTCLSPEQIVRYCWGGETLWMSENKPSVIPKCNNCGSVRVFEFQLMPTLISWLQFEDKSEFGLDFGVVAVFCCSNSCFTKDECMKEEYCFVQECP